jgi:aminopeptidase N
VPGTNLTRDEAASRAALLHVNSYDVVLDLTTGPTTFLTSTTVRFAARAAGVGTWIDFVGDSVTSVTLNGVALDPAEVFADSRIALPALAPDNVLVVDAVGRYTNSGEGLHRFVDPVDNEVYLYSQFEVPDSRRVYAVFEQPDLKATFAFTATVPDHWVVVSNQPAPEPVPDGEGRATWAFEPTPRISSYITALCAGPYTVRWDEVQGRDAVIPMGIFARRSITEHVDYENLFDCTKAGILFFEKEFDGAFPFAKYDQLFVPEYNAGAMENAGCVTITDAYVFRGQPSEPLVERRALTILHELAHMWFGDLVTMKWWDDLWLNESFAEWASSVCQAEATEWPDAWTTFHSHEKTWAYQQDQQSDTHPVYADMRDLVDVTVNFDGITYAKGGSVLKQLVAYVGRDAFLAHPRGFENSLAHSLVVASVWDMTRDGEMSATAYLPYAMAIIAGERDSNLLRTMLAQVQTCLVGYLAPEHRDEAWTGVLARLRDLIPATEPGSDAQLQIVTAYAALLRPGDDTTLISGLLDGSDSVSGLSMDTDMRWGLLTALGATGAADVSDFDAELERDNTATGRERHARARASLPTAAAKQEAWADGVENPDTRNSVIEALANGFLRGTDTSLLVPYIGRFHEAILPAWEARTFSTLESINAFYPWVLAGPELRSATQAWLAEHADAPAALRRILRENLDGVERAMRAQARDAASA